MLEEKFTGNCSFILKHSLIHLQSPLYTSEGGDESGVYPGNNMGAHPEWDISSSQLTTHWHHTWWQFSTDNFTTSWFLGGAANQMARKKPTRTWGEHVNLYKDSKPNSGSNQRCEVATLTTPHPSYNITYKKKKMLHQLKFSIKWQHRNSLRNRAAIFIYSAVQVCQFTMWNIMQKKPVLYFFQMKPQTFSDHWMVSCAMGPTIWYWLLLP